MPGEVDPRLMGLLQAVLGLADALRDAGTSGPVTVRLDREDGLLLLKLVAGANDAEVEAWSQRGQPPETGVNCLKVAGLTFEWPQVKVMPGGVGAAANENSRRPCGRELPRCSRRCCGLLGCSRTDRGRPHGGSGRTIQRMMAIATGSQRRPATA